MHDCMIYASQKLGLIIYAFKTASRKNDIDTTHKQTEIYDFTHQLYDNIGYYKKSH